MIVEVNIDYIEAKTGEPRHFQQQFHMEPGDAWEIFDDQLMKIRIDLKDDDDE